MAYLIKSNSTYSKIDTDGPLHINQISTMLQGIVNPFFVGLTWVFVNANGQRMLLPYNKKMSEEFGIDIFGDVVIANPNELTPEFFCSKELVEFMKNMVQSKMIKESEVVLDPGQMLNNQESTPTDDELDKQWLNIFSNNAYNRIMSCNTIQEFTKDFIIYKDNERIIQIPETDKLKRIEVLNKIIDHFAETEEYEKCKIIKNVINFIIDEENK